MKSDAYSLQRGVWGVPIRGVLDGAFDLVDECLNEQVGVARCANLDVVFLQVGGINVRVSCVQMVQDGAGGGGSVAHIALVEGTDEHFVDGSDENFSKVLVGATVLAEEDGGNIMGVAKVGDLVAGHNRWYGGIGTGVNRSNEIRGR